ncbi:helix-turn-helix domain-containing protein [Virgibacillus proomii]|uniref:helix-turn-helix domain-containing protein n=1 Tax=Virgibacillus proomii TaxID=84407 RepID=UPI001C12585C|nr:helix-turn-helix transcriptional regulator [Virgibacillus proomii]
MSFSYNKLDKILEKKGLSYNKLYELGLITDYSCRQLIAGKSVQLNYLVNICEYLNVTLDDIIEIIKD